jgi:hypothetical protein
MEHNFIFNSSAEISFIHDLLLPIFTDYSTYASMRSIVKFGNETMPDPNDFPDVSLNNLLDRLGTALEQAKEEEKPIYEHRYAVRNSEGETLQEYDSLNDAWEVYAEYYEEDYAHYRSVDSGDYDIFDNKLQLVVTDAVPSHEYEYHYNVSLDVELDGDSIDVSDVPSSVMEDIVENFSCGDDYGYVYDNIGDTDWVDIADWETDHEETKDEVADPAPTEPETVTEPDNTWHIY